MQKYNFKQIVNKKNVKRTLLLLAIILLFSYFTTVAVRALTLKKNNIAPPLSIDDRNTISEYLDGIYPERKNLLNPLPYNATPASLDVLAESAIAVETKTGCILYEKNADTIIPPA